MEEKKATKISLSTFFLIIAIVAILVMAYFLYISNSKATNMISSEKELNAKIAKLEAEITNKNTTIKAEQNNVNNSLNSEENSNEVSDAKDTVSNTSNIVNNIAFSSLKGKYIGNLDVKPGTTPDGETEVSLYLYENGSYRYNNKPGLDSGYVGYYTFDDNHLILHEIIECGNDIGRTITNDTITLKINNDNSITDSNLNAIFSSYHKRFLVMRVGDVDYISLTDLSRYKNPLLNASCELSCSLSRNIVTSQPYAYFLV